MYIKLYSKPYKNYSSLVMCSINDNDIVWGHGQNSPETSRCSEPCLVGQIKQVYIYLFLSELYRTISVKMIIF